MAAGPRGFAGVRFTSRAAHGRPAVAPAAAAAVAVAAAGAATGGQDRYVPVGRMILFHDETISGELDVMSYVHTASGARLIAAWQTRDPLGSRPRGLPPIEDFTVTDDRGNRYELRFAAKGRRESAGDRACTLTRRRTSAGWRSPRRVSRPSGSTWEGPTACPHRRSATRTSAPVSSC